MEAKTARETKMVRVTPEAWGKARMMAALRKVKEQEDADISAVTSEAILDSWEKLPAEVRDFLEHAGAESEAKAA